MYMIMHFKNKLCISKLYIFAIYLLKKFCVKISCQAACIHEKFCLVFFWKRRLSKDHHRTHKSQNVFFRDETRWFATNQTDRGLEMIKLYCLQKPQKYCMRACQFEIPCSITMFIYAVFYRFFVGNIRWA